MRGAKSGKLILDGWSGAQSSKLSALINGWKNGLLGQTAGSRVMLVVPAADSYPNGEPSKGLEVGEGVVYVIDVLDVQAPPERKLTESALRPRDGGVELIGKGLGITARAPSGVSCRPIPSEAVSSATTSRPPPPGEKVIR